MPPCRTSEASALVLAISLIAVGLLLTAIQWRCAGGRD